MEKNIVIIDNNFAIREILKLSIDSLSKINGDSLNLYTSQNGIEGLGFVYLTHPEIVIIDTTLPKYSGNELLYFLLSNKKFHNGKVKIIVLTERKQHFRVPANFVVLDKSSKDFVSKLNKIVATTTGIPIEKEAEKIKLIERILRLSNRLDILQVKFSKESLLGKMLLIPKLVVLDVFASILLSILFITKGHIPDSNVKQEKRDLSLLRRRHYPTAVGSFIAVIMAGVVLASFIFSQNFLFNEVKEDTQAFGYGEVGWYSTMDSSSDVTNPIEGSSAQVLNGVDFVTDSYPIGDDEFYEIKSARFDANNEVIKINNPIKNTDYNLEKGTVEFMYSPLEVHTTDKEMTFFSVYGDENNKIEFKKLNDVDDSLSLKYICEYCGDAEIKVSGADYSFGAGDWVSFVLNWNAFASPGEQLSILVNGEVLPSIKQGSVNPGSIIDPSAIFIGNSSPTGTNYANGKIDEFKIYLDIASPSATPIGTPPPTPVYTQGSGQPSWYSTMDSISAITTPQVGNVPGILSGASFIPGPAGFGSASYYDTAGQSIYIEAVPELHYSLNEGAVEFYYKPNFEANYNTEVNLFSIRQDDDEEIRFFKKDNSGSNLLVFSYLCGPSCGGEETIQLTDYQNYWKAGKWVFMRVTWNDDDSLLVGEQMKVFLNGVQPPHTNQTEKIQGNNIATSPNAPIVYIGNHTQDGGNPALGAIDEFKMFTTTVVPTPTPTLPITGTPTSSITPTPSIVPTATPTPLWYSTMDSASAVTSPVYGQPGIVGGAVNFLPGSPFVSESNDNKAASYFYKWNEDPNIIVNTNNAAVNETRGRITFYYRPNEGVFDGVNQTIIQLKIDNNNRIHLYKNANPSYLQFEYSAKASGANNYNRLRIYYPDFNWNSGDWIYFELNYDITLPQDQQVRLFYSVQGGPLVEPVHTHTGTVSSSLGQVTKMFVGGDDTWPYAFPRGRIDEFKLYGYYNLLPTATVPSGSPTPSPIPAFNILWYSTLVNPTAAWQPVVGYTPTAVYNTTFVNNGVPEARAGADFGAAQANIQVIVDGSQASKDVGKVEFWYKPNVAYNYNDELDLFRIRGLIFDRIELLKRNNSGNNTLDFKYDARCEVQGTQNCTGPDHGPASDTRVLSIASSTYQSYWVVNKWIKFTLTWDYFEAVEADKLKLTITYHNGSSWQTVPLTGSVSGVMNPIKMDNFNALYIGNGNYYPYSYYPARGVISEFKIWGLGAGISPTPTPTPVPLTAGDPIWYSTLDNANALTTPVVGKGATSSSVTYESGVNSNAVRIDANSEHITVNSMPGTDFKKDKGAIEFYYRPDVGANANQAIHLFNVRSDDNNRFRMYKTNSVTSPLYLSYTHGGTTRNISIPLASFQPYWQAGRWTLMRVEWDRSKSSPDHLKIFMNNIRPGATPSGSVFSDFTGTPNVYIGNITNTGTEPAMGVIDDFTIFGDPDSRRFTVNSTQDSGDSNIGDRICSNSEGYCTLRAAIQEANNTDAYDTIRFNIPGGDIHKIVITTPLPAITKQLTIDATTQTGANCTTSELKIILSGSNFTGNGLTLSNISNNQIKGLVIYGFNKGISLSNSSGNVLTCNIIGLDADGETVKGNVSRGIDLEAGSANNTIGGENAVDKNIISSSSRGIGIKNSNNTTIRGNYIGTNKSGVSAKGNIVGIEIDSSSNTVIGNSNASSLPSSCISGCNLVSGNSSAGISFVKGSTASDSNTIKANYIGTNQTGTGEIVNYDGIRIIKSNTDTVEYNLLVSTNSNIYAYSSTGANLTGLNINNNIIGTDKTATTKLIDSSYGVVMFASQGSSLTSSNINSNVIGGSVRGAGVYVYGPGLSDLTIKSNYIGTNSSSANLGNKQGIYFVFPESSSITIGGTDISDKNEIAYNTNYGIYLSNTSNSMIRKNKIFSNTDDGIAIIGNNTSVNNTIIENSIYNNGGLGINHRTATSDGVTYNDPGDTDSTLAGDGPNDLQNYPVLTKALYSGSTLTLYGGFQSRVDKYYRLDFYSSSSSDPSGFGEGENHFYTVNSKPGSLYDFSVNPLVISTTLPAGHRYISITATECGEQACTTLLSTSEFGFTGFDGDFIGKSISIDKNTGNLDKLYLSGEGNGDITDVFAYNIQVGGDLDLIQSVNVPNMSTVGSVGLDNNYFAVAGLAESNQYRVYSFEDGYRCSYDLGSNAKVTDIALERNGVGSKYIYLTSNVSGKQFSVIQGLATSSTPTLSKYGEYRSEVKDMGTPVKSYHSLSWNETLNGGKVRLQVRSGDTINLSNQEWYGPDGTRGSYYELSNGNSGDIIPKVVQGKRYLQYRLLLEADAQISPSLDSITIRYGN